MAGTCGQRRRNSCQPSLPKQFKALYPEGTCPGWCVMVKGETSSHTSMFEINLLSHQIVLHFNPHFSSSKTVCNSLLTNHLGKE
ncbi:PREDICTED: grifin-like [Chaetura pelagica]|uniref:grifin-like n=1 Tax=Chaetura pelagica TaxID=8897 RepID=UPI00052352F9|nr:PREDICTED: grifin-like [Chaetura pelagica]